MLLEIVGASANEQSMKRETENCWQFAYREE